MLLQVRSALQEKMRRGGLERAREDFNASVLANKLRALDGDTEAFLLSRVI